MFPTFAVGDDFLAVFCAGLGRERELWTAVTEDDGVCRLRLTGAGPVPQQACLPTVSLKKLLMPSGEQLWTSSGQNGSEPYRVVLNAALCDLQALHYLDRVFADDESYQRHRQRLLLIGMPCLPAAECVCDIDAGRLAGDLYCEPGRVWQLSARGGDVLDGLPVALRPLGQSQLPLPVSRKTRVVIEESHFHNSAKAEIWEEEARRCLSCGACSVVCPTCYCFDMIDEPGLKGQASRQRRWDNCFFHEFAEVAGGYNFHPDRLTRLRFRFEHKYLGFGELRGEPACVGCGRCRRACPVEIDLEAIGRRLSAEGCDA